MKYENGRMVREHRKGNNKGIFTSIRCYDGFIELCEKVALDKNMSRNELILVAVTEYCNKYLEEHNG